MKRFVCIHCHFYQPPRENPWLEAIELQDSAYPFHDWNERITDESYAPNASSRILGSEGRIVKITNNYSRISFNFGPTLLSWMEHKAPEVYQAIIRADKESQERFSGHGSALAQVYNHMIMPLANMRDRVTQVRWGVRDFESRFGRFPEGMWLPETAADTKTLEVMAELGIHYTILAPHQAKRIRRIGSEHWEDVSNANVDPSRAYVANLPSGRKIHLFFYDGPISRAVAFERLLSSGEFFASRIAEASSHERDWPQLLHIATDGETYGHHHRHGDMALAYALEQLETNGHGTLTNYGEYLEKHPPTHEAEIIDNTSWSCIHGVERWKSDCGCHSGMHPEWSQAWRAPLRESLDWLRDSIASKFEHVGSEIFKDPWAARDAYIGVILDRSRDSIASFLEQHAARHLDEAERSRALKLMELQRHAMLMYTSCGWFFDDLSGIETVQVIQYAGRVIQLAQSLFGEDYESGFLERLQRASSNVHEQGDGRRIYERAVRPAMVDLTKVAAHYAVSSLFEENTEDTPTYCYDIEREDYRVVEAGRTRLALGRVRITSKITLESETLSFGLLHFGDHNLNGGVRSFRGEEEYQRMVKRAEQAFSRADFPELLRVFDAEFGASTYSLKSLFRDEQRKVVSSVLESTLEGTEMIYRQIYDAHAPLMRFLADIGMPLPDALQKPAEFVLNTSLKRTISEDEFDLDRIAGLLDDARARNIALDSAGLAFALEDALERMTDRLLKEPDEIDLLRKLDGASALAEDLPFEVDLWRAQNVCYELYQSVYSQYRKRADNGDELAREWVERFRSFGANLSVKVK
ncbi:MAG: DUF3536 domain-containing protein [Phycisphaeraceae bacterium]|nr:MAG: DUF3536 domain-containing protein [Phycisphaeraceae bacterium]